MDVDPPVRARITAFASIAMYEGYAADDASALRSLAGQVNGLWNVPVPPGRGTVDGAIVAAEAQRIVLGSLLSDSLAQRVADSVAVAQAADRRATGVRQAVVSRSQEHGAAIARVILAAAAAEVSRTLVLRHPRECALAAAGTTRDAVQQGAPQAAVTPHPPASAAEAAEATLLATIVGVDAREAASVKGAPGPVDHCVSERVQGRLRTRHAAP